MEAFNSEGKRFILRDGEEICSECNGDGIVMGDYPYSDTCPKCNGVGITDWITNVVGVKSITKRNY